MKEVGSERCFRKEEGGARPQVEFGRGYRVYNPVTLYELVLRYCVQYSSRSPQIHYYNK